jgi:oxygen-independent coproporphyrinogen-3 oxidase
MPPQLHRSLDSITPYHNLPNPALAIYVHIPFCRSRCTYCVFNTYTGLSTLRQAYVEALTREMALVAGSGRYPVNTVYFGGGTPSLLPATTIASILRHCADVFALDPDAEITLEANPGSVNQDYLAILRSNAVNRLSIGMQSAHESELRMFGRTHSLKDVRTAVSRARLAGFDNISLDLIYGNPHQTMAMWQTSLNCAIEMNPDHVSLYSLGIEKATPLFYQIDTGQIPSPDPDLGADMYEFATGFLAAQGYHQYEISNWARPGAACQHNLHVWRNRSFLGFGAGAHGFAENTRYANLADPTEYVERIRTQTAPSRFPLSDAAETVDHVHHQQIMADTMILSLRLTEEGVSLANFRHRFGVGVQEVYDEALNRLIAHGLLEVLADRVRLTRRGRLLGNHVFVEFV